MTSTQRQKEYLAIRIAAASPMELVRILYEGAVQAVHDAIRALHSGDILARGEAINKAIEILAELRLSLRLDVQEQYSNTLAELYSYMQHQLIRAHAEYAEYRRRVPMLVPLGSTNRRGDIVAPQPTATEMEM